MTEFKAQGYKCLNNHGGLEIELDHTGDHARLRYFGKVSRWQVIKWAKDRDVMGYGPGMYVTYYGQRHFLNEFMRCDYPLSLNINLLDE